MRCLHCSSFLVSWFLHCRILAMICLQGLWISGCSPEKSYLIYAVQNSNSSKHIAKAESMDPVP